MDATSDYSNKRARTEERSVSSAPSDSLPLGGTNPQINGLKTRGAAAVKPNEVIVEQVAGKKRSRFWYYAVEPTSETSVASPASVVDSSVSAAALPSATGPMNGYTNGDLNGDILQKVNGTNGVGGPPSQVPYQNGGRSPDLPSIACLE